MARDTEASGVLTKLVGAALFGAAAMYALDPDKGRRRRAIARDKARSLAAGTRDAVGVTRRDVTHRFQGLRARARRLFGNRTAADDLQLIERVRARMGREVSHSHAIQVGAHAGHVTLSGPILADEVEPLLQAVRGVFGVTGVEDRLVVHEHPESVPSLQGGTARSHANGLQQNWPPAVRAAALLGGTLLALYGVQRRTLGGCALIGVGAGLAARGATNLPLARIAALASARRAIEVEKSVQIAAAPETVYDAWSRWQNLPRFMSHVHDVRDLGDGRTHWIVHGPGGTRVEWQAALTRSVRPQMLAWRTEPDSLVRHEGSVRFEPFADGTRVSVKLRYDAPGRTGHALASALGDDPRHRMNEDLARMKAFIEGQPAQEPVRADESTRPALH
jgi:uncharacterized membrane protein